jgi:hypothetical protein
MTEAKEKFSERLHDGLVRISRFGQFCGKAEKKWEGCAEPLQRGINTLQ